MIYKLKQDDEVKILPIIKKDGSFIPIFGSKCVFVDNKIIYDDYQNNKNYLTKIIQKNLLKNGVKKPLTTRTFICIYHENQIKFSVIGKTITDLLMKDYKFDPRNNLHLKVKIDSINSHIGTIPGYDKSVIIEKDWDKPINDINSQHEWLDFIRQNQPFYVEDYLSDRNIFRNIESLKKEFDDDCLSDIIKENRDLQLNKILD